MTNLTPRLQALEYWGRPESPALAVNLVSAQTFTAARKRGGVSGLRLYRADSSGGIEQPAIGLDFKTVYGETKNAASAWTATVDSESDFSEIANAFDSAAPGLLYSNAANGADASFVSTFDLDANRAFSLRFFLFTPHEDQPRQILAVMWGRWRLEIEDRRPQLLRLSAAWTSAKQAELDALLDSDEQLSEIDQTAADVLRAEIYEEGTSQGIEVSEQKTDFGAWFEITFIPEPRGLLNIITDKGEATVFADDIIATRAAGVLWPETNVTITTNGGAMFWQVGDVQFARRGILKAPRFKWWYAGTLSDTVPGDGYMSFRGQTDYSSPNTDVDFSLQDTSNSLEYFVQADLVSSDGNYSPFLYAVEGFVSATDRTGSTDVAWDSNDVDDFDTNGDPIKTLSPQYESEMKRRSCTVTIRNVEGKLLLPGTVQAALHDRLCNVTLGGDAFITRGIVRAAQLSTMKAATANVIPSLTTNRWSDLVIEISDQWAVMDADTMVDNPKGDGLRLGAYIRLILKGAGVPDSEMTGVSSSAGRILPSATAGEDFLLQPGGDCSRGDYLRRVVLDWGMGLILSISRAGIWTLAAPDVTIKAAFSSSATSGYRIMEPLDLIRDFGDSYNWFCAEGAEINGVVLRQTWKVQEAVSAYGWAGYVGRWRRYPTINADYCRTASDLQWVLRSHVRNFAKPGRWFQFKTRYHKDLDIGDYVTLDGVLCVIERINGGSIEFGNDRMGLLCRELISVGA